MPLGDTVLPGCPFKIDVNVAAVSSLFVELGKDMINNLMIRATYLLQCLTSNDSNHCVDLNIHCVISFSVHTGVVNVAFMIE